MPFTNSTTTILKPLETSSSIGMFARDTGGCLIARLSLARTKEEAKEITFAETTESAIFYFSAPALAKTTSKLFSKIYGLKKDEFTTPLKNLKNIDSNTLKKIKLAKFNQIAATFGIVLPFVYGIAPTRNLLTLADSGKNKFTTLVGLENKKDEKQKNKAKNKAKNLIKKLSLISISTLALAGIISLGAKNKKIYDKIELFIDKIDKLFEFSSDNDLKLSHYAALIYPFSIAGYLSASRDKYERNENIRRFSITVPLLFLGEKIIQNPIYKFFDKRFKTNVFNNGNIKSYKEILKMPDYKQKNYLKSKNFSYGLTFLTNTILIAAAVALLNRFETKRKYLKDNKKQISFNRPVGVEEYKKLLKTKSFN